jgi:putative transposase
LTEVDRIQKQIIAILREQEAGTKTADVCRRHGISEATFYARTSKVRWSGRVGGQAAEGTRG